MRALMLVLLLVTLLPMAQARDLPVEYDYDVHADRDGVSADVTVAQTYPDNCADCGGIGVNAGGDASRDGAGAHASVCRGGFFYICVVDEDVRVL